MTERKFARRYNRRAWPRIAGVLLLIYRQYHFREVGRHQTRDSFAILYCRLQRPEAITYPVML
jgi:hypothetical protein